MSGSGVWKSWAYVPSSEWGKMDIIPNFLVPLDHILYVILQYPKAVWSHNFISVWHPLLCHVYPATVFIYVEVYYIFKSLSVLNKYIFSLYIYIYILYILALTLLWWKKYSHTLVKWVKVAIPQCKVCSNVLTSIKSTNFACQFVISLYILYYSNIIIDVCK